MEAKEGGSNSGVIVVRSDAPTNYEIAPRIEVNADEIPASESTPSPLEQVASQPGLKKKRGRPRKYGADGAVTVALSAKPISTSSPSAPSAAANVIDFSTEKRPSGKVPKVKLASASPVLKQHQPQHQHQHQHQAQQKHESENCGMQSVFVDGFVIMHVIVFLTFLS